MTQHAITALVAVERGIDEDAVRSLLAETRDLELAGVVAGLDAGWTAVTERPTDIVLLACAPESEQALWFLRESARAYPDRPVLVLCPGSPNGFVRHAFEAGAEDLLTLTDDALTRPQAAAEDLMFAVEKAVARRTGAAAGVQGALASLICVLGPKGGIGKTLTTTNLGVALAAEGRKVAIVDLDLQFGDVGLSLGLEPQRTIYDLVKSGGSLDAEKVDAYLTRHASGARVLMAPVRPDQAGSVTIDFLRDVYALLRATHDYVIVDTPPGFSPEVIASIDSSTHVVMVGMLDSLSLKNSKLGLQTLSLMGYESERIRVVLNRADTKVGVTPEDVTAVLGRAPDVMVPSHRDVVRSINEGCPVVLSRPRSDVARAFTTLAAGFIGRPAERKRRLRRMRRAA
jgi:pilus assembly protein CpaE